MKKTIFFLTLFLPLLGFAVPLNKAYVQTHSGVSVIDITNNTLLKTIPGTDGVGIDILPDNTRVYAANELNDTVAVIDTSQDEIIEEIHVGVDPMFLIISPDGKKAYVSNSTSGTVSVIDTSRNIVSDTITLGGIPRGIAVSPDNSIVYVSNGDSNIYVINAANNAVLNKIPIAGGSGLAGLVVSSDGRKLYAANGFPTGMNVLIIDTQKNQVIKSLTVGNMPVVPTLLYLPFHSNATEVFVASVGTNTITVIDIATDTIKATFPSGGVSPIGIGILATSPTAYVVNNESFLVTVFNALTYQELTSITTPGKGFFIAVPKISTQPKQLSGVRIQDKYINATDNINRITWFPGDNIVPPFYKIFRNGVLIAIVAGQSGLNSFDDHNQDPDATTTYTVVASFSGGSDGTPASIVFQPSECS